MCFGNERWEEEGVMARIESFIYLIVTKKIGNQDIVGPLHCFERFAFKNITSHEFVDLRCRAQWGTPTVGLFVKSFV